VSGTDALTKLAAEGGPTARLLVERYRAAHPAFVSDDGSDPDVAIPYELAEHEQVDEMGYVVSMRVPLTACEAADVAAIVARCISGPDPFPPPRKCGRPRRTL
jgi:hypothetical protein